MTPGLATSLTSLLYQIEEVRNLHYHELSESPFMGGVLDDIVDDIETALEGNTDD